MENKVLYICDRKKCETCREDCTHTQDIRHAKNFEKISPGVFRENKTGLYVFRATMHMKERDLQHIAENIVKQMKTGVVLVPSYIAVEHIPENSAVKIESEDD